MTSVSGSDRLGRGARPHSPGTGRTCGGRRGLQSCPRGLPEATGKNKSRCDQALVCGPGGEGCGGRGLGPRAPTLPLGSARRSEDQPKWVLTPSSPNIASLITLSPPAGMPAAPQGCLPSFGATRLSKRLLPGPAGMCLWHRNALCSLGQPLQAKPCRVPSPGHRPVPAS